MESLAALGLIAALATAFLSSPLAGQTPADSPAVKDSSAIHLAAAAHYAVPDSVVAQLVTIRGDTAWASVRAAGISLVIARLEHRTGRWLVVSEALHGIRNR
jgi:hypothetical protein